MRAKWLRAPPTRTAADCDSLSAALSTQDSALSTSLSLPPRRTSRTRRDRRGSPDRRTTSDPATAAIAFMTS